MRVQFPPDFLWGTSISSYQVEGNNVNSDWYRWEREHRLTPAAEAANHYTLFSHDFTLAKQLAHNACRFSVEWARIYPEKSSFSSEALAHYVDVCDDLCRKNITPILCLHHFTNPLWLASEGGWLNPRSVDYFREYTHAVVSALKSKIRYWITFNEPCVYVYNGFIRGNWPPGYCSLPDALKALTHITRAHSQAYALIKSLCGDTVFVSIAKHMRIFDPCAHANYGQNNLFAFLRSGIFNFAIIDILARRRCLDFIGLNYYCKEFVGTKGIFGKECRGAHHHQARNERGWFPDPSGLYHILRKLKRYRVPVIITENGTVAATDQGYSEFLDAHLRMLARALCEGVDIRGYLWWSLIDNFEWHKGFQYPFGLIKVDFNTFSRTIKPFARHYKKIIEENAIEI